MSGDAIGGWILIVLILAIAGYYAFVRWLEHREFMAGKRKPDEEGE